MNNINKSYVFAISMVSAMGGLLFGYDWVVIGGAKPFYERFFDINTLPALQAWAMSSALIGCIAGALFSGLVSDRYGRKLPLMAAALLFTVSALGTGMVSDFLWFIMFRIVGGVGIGLASALSPMYIAEVAPAKMRGGFVSLNQFTIVIGILAAQVINMLIAETVPADATDTYIKESWNGQMGWRWMFMVEAIPAFLFFILVTLVPESPRWLVKAGRADKALPTLSRIGGAEYARTEIENIRESLNNAAEKDNLRELFKKAYRPILFIGIFLAVFQQWSGLNTVFNYADEIFRAAGYGVSDTLFNIVITGSVNLVFTLVAMFTVDKWGRKKLMLFGAAGLSITYILLGSAYFFELKGIAVLSLVVIAIAVYAMSLAPVVWVVLSEIFPNRIRGAAMALATFSLWVACFILTYTFPLLNASLGASGTFWVYAGICLISFVVILIKLPETKGKSLEELEKELMK